MVIERPAQQAITIHTARPGIVIGKKGEDVEVLRKEISDLMGVPAHINIEKFVNLIPMPNWLRKA